MSGAVRKIVIVAFAVIAAGAGVSWFLHVRSSQASMADERQGMVVLRLETYEPGQALEHGVPGFLRVDVASPAAERLRRHREEGRPAAPLPDMQLGTEEDPWWKGLRLTRRNGDREEELAFDVIDARKPAVRLEKGEMGYALVAIRPDVPLPANTCLLIAHLPVPFGEAGEVQSEELPLPVRPSGLSAASKERLLSLYYRGTGRLDEAVRAAERAVRAEPGRMGGYVAKAEALEEMGRYVEARQAYVEAMEYFPPDSYEPPTLYREAMERLSRKIRERGAR